MVEHNKS